MISILDTTYREGKQSYLSNILPDSILKYARILQKIGIEYIEVAYPFISKKYLRHFRQLVRSKLNIKLCVHSALKIENFEKLKTEGVTSIAVSLKFEKLNKRIIDEQLSAIKKIIKEYKSKQNIPLTLRVGVERAFELPHREVVSLCERMTSIKEISRISISDSNGSAVPDDICKLLNRIDQCLPRSKTIELHLHNDCGLAGANFYEAYKLFKNSKRKLIVDTSISGIGERNGILSLGDIFSILYTKDKNILKEKYNINHYSELYDLVFKKGVYNRDPLNPKAFSHSSGLHISKFLESHGYQVINPEVFGQKSELIFNESISSEALRVFAKIRLGFNINKKDLTKITSKIRNLSANREVNFNNKEILKIFSDYIK